MRLAILSDIHGNLIALDAVLDDIGSHGPFDALGVAGDLCEWGPQPREALRRVQALGCPVVQGNTDRDVSRIAPYDARFDSGRAPSAAEWTRAQIGDDGAGYLAGLPFSHTFAGPDGHDVLMVHANPRDQDTHLEPDAPAERVEYLLAGATADVIVFGHLHTPYVRSLGRRLLVDVSSAGYPRDGDQRAAYATLEWDGAWTATIRRVAYDLAATAQALTASGIPRAEKRIADLYRASYG